MVFSNTYSVSTPYIKVLTKLKKIQKKVFTGRSNVAKVKKLIVVVIPLQQV